MNIEDVDKLVKIIYKTGKEKGLKPSLIKSIILDSLNELKQKNIKDIFENGVDKEYKDLNRYFRLCLYRDGEYMLEDEYRELDEIIKRSKKAQEMEDARHNAIIKKISEEEYNNLCDLYYEELNEKLKERDILIEKKKKEISYLEKSIKNTF